MAHLGLLASAQDSFVREAVLPEYYLIFEGLLQWLCACLPL